jgi:predicted dehydrogenase
MQVVGSAGIIYMDMFAQQSTLYSDRTMRVEYQGWGSNADMGLVRAFVDAVATGAPVPVTGVDGLAAAEVALAAYRSAQEHQPVHLPLAK